MGEMLENEEFQLNIWAEFSRDPLLEARGWWLECGLFLLGMNIVYSHDQFHFQINEIFKSEDGLIQ